MWSEKLMSIKLCREIFEAINSVPFFFQKANISYSLMSTRMENFAYVLNGENGEKFLEEFRLLVGPKDCITNNVV